MVVAFDVKHHVCCNFILCFRFHIYLLLSQRNRCLGPYNMSLLSPMYANVLRQCTMDSLWLHNIYLIFQHPAIIDLSLNPFISIMFHCKSFITVYSNTEIVNLGLSKKKASMTSNN